MASAGNLLSQVSSCMCLMFLFNMAKARAYTPPMMILTCVLCLCSSSSGYNLLKTIASVMGIPIPFPV